MITDRKAIHAAETIIEYCRLQGGCQNCIFRKHASDHWDCHMDAFDLRDVLDNLSAKRKNHGYI